MKKLARENYTENCKLDLHLRSLNIDLKCLVEAEVIVVPIFEKKRWSLMCAFYPFVSFKEKWTNRSRIVIANSSPLIKNSEKADVVSSVLRRFFNKFTDHFYRYPKQYRKCRATSLKEMVLQGKL